MVLEFSSGVPPIQLRAIVGLTSKCWMSYWSLDDILAHEERLPCTFLSAAINLGYLDASLPGEDLEAGAKLELPMWLAATLVKRNLVTADLPKCLSKKARDQIIADPQAVRLREKNPYFYQVAAAATKIVAHPDATTFPTLVRACLAARSMPIIDKATNSLEQDTSSFTSGLTDLEQRLHFDGYQQSKDLKAWRQRDIATLSAKPSVMLAKAKRRKMR